jgi:voltage-gated potassium channel
VVSVVSLAEEIERDGIPVVTGEAAEEETLQRAGIAKAVSLVATLGSDADNLFLTLTARGMNPELDIIARAEDDRNCRKFIQAGASRVVSPLDAGSNRIIRLITRPDIVDFVELMAEGDDIQFEISKITLDDSSQFAGKTLAEGHVRQEAGGMVMAVKRSGGRTLFDPSPDLRLEPGDSLFIVGNRQ